jgi:hypothetical protein
LRLGELRLGELRLGELRLGELRLGELRLGEWLYKLNDLNLHRLEKNYARFLFWASARIESPAIKTGFFKSE